MGPVIDFKVIIGLYEKVLSLYVMIFTEPLGSHPLQV